MLALLVAGGVTGLMLLFGLGLAVAYALQPNHPATANGGTGSAASTVTASSAARFATPWVCSHRSGEPLHSNVLARPRASAINIGEGSTAVIAAPHQ